MKSLEDQWHSHRDPLTQQIEDLRLKASSRQAEVEQKLSELQDFKQQMKVSSDDARTKDEQLKSLVCNGLLILLYCVLSIYYISFMFCVDDRVSGYDQRYIKVIIHQENYRDCGKHQETET